MSTPTTPEQALGAMRTWIESPLEFGQAPVELELWHQKQLAWLGGAKAQCFLIRFKMADGYESVGFAGPVTWAFTDLPMTEILRLRKGDQARDLFRLYYGWATAFITLQKDPHASTHAPAELAERIAHLQRRKESQLPVNLTFKDFLKVGKEEYWVLAGDLLYNRPAAPVPAEGELHGIVVSMKPKKGSAELMGEPHRVFYLWKSKTKGFGRGSQEDPLEGRFPLFMFLGREYGPK